MRAIQIGIVDSINRNYQIMIVSILKNLSHRYSSHCIIKFVYFMRSYHVINLDIVSSFMVFSNSYLRSFNLL